MGNYAFPITSRHQRGFYLKRGHLALFARFCVQGPWTRLASPAAGTVPAQGAIPLRACPDEWTSRARPRQNGRSSLPTRLRLCCPLSQHLCELAERRLSKPALARMVAHCTCPSRPPFQSTASDRQRASPRLQTTHTLPVCSRLFETRVSAQGVPQISPSGIRWGISTRLSTSHVGESLPSTGDKLFQTVSGCARLCETVPDSVKLFQTL